MSGFVVDRARRRVEEVDGLMYEYRCSIPTLYESQDSVEIPSPDFLYSMPLHETTTECSNVMSIAHCTIKQYNFRN